LDSAYAALGLKRGAGRAEVDEAYRRLIKQYHPDRTGGDGSRAAEINRAYTMLRRQGKAVAPRRMPPVPVRPPRHRRRGGRATGLFLVGFVLVIAIVGYEQQEASRKPNSGYLFAQPSDPYDQELNEQAASRLTAFDEPLDTAGIDKAVTAAVNFHHRQDSNGSVEYSRVCHTRLRNHPTLSSFDACAAFDEATSALNDGNPGADSGPFNTSEITARQIASAQMISDDMIGADSRLHQIRSRVELELVPLLDKAAAQNL
jgi:hypothetical protein